MHDYILNHGTHIISHTLLKQQRIADPLPFYKPSNLYVFIKVCVSFVNDIFKKIVN
jgi:hypothetical protein